MEPVHALSAFCSTVIFQDHAVESITFSQRNDFISWLGTVQRGLDLESILALDNYN